ncbi:hypothetical protein ABIC28_002078 [Rhodococcus sp. PvR044]|jgi:hypothetical protein|uniref:LLM class flavin-dependent oxidoreductase n=1 Tax=unclassified Rhodococcus (in: high G+C Gram-positive bacteria) TaxID=192944 RepID=UPI000BDBD737|nr:MULTISPECIES: LLM class flavin-dependent oxidoreductase [unclassified Rhodococcus (in: high G+C Gram-positive bacteria)]MBP1160918.1 hypothetical protein [Rhodococcus sp. PvR099]PTR39997.1 luciferase-like monooxygenase [Rhodococcus sp. OK611]SNX92464.1 Luciferase-like monooxygenase [Rhodococcus sp. OK270]
MSIDSSFRTRPLHVAVELSGAGHHPASAAHTDFRIPLGLTDYWVDLTAPADPDAQLDLAAIPGTVVRIRAHDLRGAQQQRDRIRADAAADGRDPDSVTVLLDVEVLLGDDSRSARRELALLDGGLRGVRVPDSISYVGTASGLAGLIADIRAAGVADGVTLLPLVLPRVLDRVVDDVLPLLHERGVTRPSAALGEVLGQFGLTSGRSILAS